MKQSKTDASPENLAVMLDAVKNGREYIMPANKANSFMQSFYFARREWINRDPSLEFKLGFEFKKSLESDNKVRLRMQRRCADTDQYLVKGTPASELKVEVTPEIIATQTEPQDLASTIIGSDLIESGPGANDVLGSLFGEV